MATFDNAVNIIIRTDGAPVGRAGFSSAIIVDAQQGSTERLLFFSSVAEAQAAQTGSQITAAQLAHITAGFSQQNRPAMIGAGRGDADVAQVDTVTVGGTPADTETFTITINGTDYTATAAGGDDAAAVATKLRTALAAVPGVTVGGAGADVTLTATVAGTPFTTTTSTTSAAGTLSLVNTTASASIATGLAAILEENAAGWYGFGLVSRSALDLQRAAAWAEANQRFFIAQSSDSDILSAVDTDVFSVLQSAGYHYTKLFWYSNNAAAPAFALLTDRLSNDPDVRTTIWDFVPLAGITPDVDNITTTQLANLTSKNGGAYLTLAGVGVTGGGNRQASGRFSDVQITVDWYRARLDEAHANLLISASRRGTKIPYTDTGFEQVGAVARGVLELGIRAGHFEAATDDEGAEISPFVRLPRRSTLSGPDVDARRLRYTSGALLAGAVQGVELTSDLTDNLETLAQLATV